MDLKSEARDNINILMSTFSADRPKALLNYAIKNRNFMDCTISAGNAERHAVAAYVLQMYYYATQFSEEINLEESYQIVSLLMGLEATRTDCWSYGTKLLYDLKIAGIDLNRDEVAAFLAQEGTWESNKYNKGKLIEGNAMAVAFYCGNLAAMYGSLIGNGTVLPGNDADPGIMAKIESCYGNSPMETIENLLKTFVPAFIGQENEGVLASFMAGIRKLGFYMAPASTKYHLSRKEGLAEHTINVFIRHVELERPTDMATVGKCILTAVCHDLCKCLFYAPNWARVKVYKENGQGKFSEPDGSKSYDWEDALQYKIDDKMPFGHGRKSLYIALGYFKGLITEEIACAIDAHMADFDQNPMVGYQFIEYPFALRLHIADMLASKLDEVING